MTGKAVSFARVTAVALAVGAGCSQVPLDQAKPETRVVARDPATPLSRDADWLTGGRAGYVPLIDGEQALGARLRLIEAAQDSLDLQYFLMKPDLGGALVTQALLDAADRGVRVRLLLDDIFTKVQDSTLVLIGAHPGIEVRLYNPSARPWPKPIGMLAEFSRVNRRMHIKSFTADQAFSIIGGRNIADEYFQLKASSEFADYDLLVMGRPVAAIGQEFDTYWNDGWAVPMSQLYAPASQQELEEARQDLNANLVPARQRYDDAVENPYIRQIGTRVTPVYKGAAQIVTDPPGKLRTPVRGGTRPLAETLLSRMRDARSDVILLTPYFVPEDYGARLFSDLARRGVRVRIVTNSLGSTNHPYVHAGYRRHRVPLLQSGVELYEVRGDALQALGLSDPDAATGVVMHTKLAVIDGVEVFVGSLNLDPRSVKLNSELGAFIASPPLARRTLAQLEDGLRQYTYRLSLDEGDKLRWNYDEDNTATFREPGSTFFKQLLVGLTELLPVEGQL